MPGSDYKKPPIGEVAFGMAFSPLAGLRSAHYGLFWSQIRNEFPETQDNPPVITAMPGVTPMLGLPLPRAWFIRSDRNLLVQLQGDRVWLNWRRHGADSEYPHFPALMEQFRQTIAKFRDFLQAENVGLLVATAFDLTYVNHIPIGDIWSSYDQVGSFMRDVAWNAGSRRLPAPDGINWSATFKIGNIRLVADLKSGKETTGDQRAVFALELRANSIEALDPVPLTDGDLDWYHRAHEAINEAFDELTTAKAQNEHWLKTS